MKSIIVEHVSKIYDVAHAQDHTIGFREMLTQQMRSLVAPTEKSEKFYALNDVSFEVEQGEVLGIIGKNGSGKSTLLKILSRITAPTSGKVALNGRIVSLLEVGTGFHEELTGRENVFMSGIILGMKRWEIYKHFDEIVSFAGVEQFIDTPVKKYSSGMRLRLAFSVAAYLQPEILLIDEVLAVGDYEFEKKCMGIMGQMEKSGRTLLFVSHNMDYIKRLCSRVLLLSQGVLKQIGTADEVIPHYFGYTKKIDGKVIFDQLEQKSLLVAVDSVEILNIQEHGTVYREDPLYIKISYRIFTNDALLSLVLLFNNAFGDLLFTGFEGIFLDVSNKKRFSGQYISTCIVPAHLFKNEKINVSLHVYNAGIEGKLMDYNAALEMNDVVCFYVVNNKNKIPSDFIWDEQGLFLPAITWKIEKE